MPDTNVKRALALLGHSPESFEDLSVYVRREEGWFQLDADGTLGQQCDGCGAAFQDDASPGITLAALHHVLAVCLTCGAKYPALNREGA